MHQPSLFPDWQPVPPPVPSVGEAKLSAQTVLRGLYTVRKNNPTSAVLPVIAEAIIQIREFLKSSDTQIEEKIIYAIERQMCWTEADIIEETRLDRALVLDLLTYLEQAKRVRRVPRYIPGSDRQYYLYKSTRQGIGEMAEF